MSGSKQIITVQLGGFANHVGAHYWNMQLEEAHKKEDSSRELSTNVNMRHTENEHGQDTYNPRAVTLGYKGSLGAIATDGELMGDLVNLQAQCQGWGGAMNLVQQSRIPATEYQQAVHTEGAAPGEGDQPSMDSDPRFWTDFCAAKFHPKSHVLLPGYMQAEFGSFVHGTQIMKQDIGEEVIERVRWFAEECDSIQGFMMPADVMDGFGGCASHTCHTLLDDFRRPLLSTPFTTSAPSQGGQALNLGLTLHHLAECSSTVLPVVTQEWQPAQFEALLYDASKQYHTSAVAAMALSTATLPSRLRGDKHISLHQQSALLRRLPSMTMSTLELWQPSAKNFTSLCQMGTEIDAQVYAEIVVQRIAMQEKYDPRCTRSVQLTWDHQFSVPEAFPQFFEASAKGARIESNDEGVVIGLPTTSRTVCGRNTGAHVTNTLSGFSNALTRDRAAVADLLAVGFESDELLEIQESLTNISLDYEDPDH
eukprot:TRINITY_DN7826_c0_g1_i12.p1 TRINITY_DN7826_c0_g1~~TRINITY_DN7826_c0_g1_i12.p1  ORF type:complete len:480 (+),score=99.75 TRINITY_DN7826_c0_g1_i12:174-1613(+)